MRYYILQLPSSSKYLFSPYNEKRKVNLHDYVPTYTDIVEDDWISGEEICEELFRKFNHRLPDHFAGHSMSVSDIIMLVPNEGEKEIYYCDMVGFKKIRSELK